MEKSITYLFGAGASFPTLPIVKEMPNSIANTLKWMEQHVLSHDEFAGYSFGKTQEQMRLELMDKLEWLKNEATRHASIDTFAKKLFVRGEIEQLAYLKAALTFFFIVQQIIQPVHSRYDSFFASLAGQDGSTVKLPKNLQILSWNYDFQFEKAYSEYSGIDSLIKNQGLLNINPIEEQTSLKSSFSIFKLNGTTGVHNQKNKSFYPLVDKVNAEMNSAFFADLVKSYAGISQPYHLSHEKKEAVPQSQDKILVT